MSGALGSLLLLWARIERTARDEVSRFHGRTSKQAHGIRAVLQDWEEAVAAAHPAHPLLGLLAGALSAQLQKSLEIRNGLCHGLIGISAERESAPAALTWESNGRQGSITWKELQASFDTLSKAPDAISMISRPSLERLNSKMMDNPENRQWWRSEFSIILPQ